MTNISQGLCHCCGKPAFVEGGNYTVAEAGCWQWTDSKDVHGYGRLNYKHRRWKTHRLSYLLAHGEMPDELVVHHTCTNRACINPEHLVAIDQGDHFNHHKRENWDLRGFPKKSNPRYVRKIPRSSHVEIRSLYKSGNYSQTKLAGMFGVSQATIWRIVHHRH